MPIIEEECKHCVPVWKLTKLMAHTKVKYTATQGRGGASIHDAALTGPGVKYRVGVQLNWTACLEDLRCAPHRRGWEDPPNLVPPARPRPTIYHKLYLPPFRAHPKYPEAGALAVGPGIMASPNPNAPDITGGFLAGQGPITFEGQIDESQKKVCCKPDVGFPNPATPPSELLSCCSAKRDIICDCYIQAGGDTTKDECCMQGEETDVFTYWSDVDPVTTSQHNILNLDVPHGDVGGSWPPGLSPGSVRDTRKSPKQMILDRMNKVFMEIGGRGRGDSNCLNANISTTNIFDPPEPSEYPDWSTRCICLGDGGNEKCPEI